MKTLFLPIKNLTVFMQDGMEDPLLVDELFKARLIRSDNLFLNWEVVKTCHKQHIYPQPELKCRIQYNVDLGNYQVLNKFYGQMTGGMEGENTLWETPSEVADWLLNTYFHKQEIIPVTKALVWHHDLDIAKKVA